MNAENLKLLERLTGKEYRKFLQNAMGLLEFNSVNAGGIILQTSKRQKDKEEYKLNDDMVVISYAYARDPESGFSELYYYYKGADENHTFRSYHGGESYEADEYFDVLGDELIFIILMASMQTIDYSALTSRKYGDLKIALKRPAFEDSFILGTGVNCKNEDSNGFGIDMWEGLIEKLKTEAAAVLKVTDKDVEDFQKDIGNTTYVIPQLAKDICGGKYYDAIYRSLYGKMKIPKGKRIESETLYQVAGVIAVQSTLGIPQTVLTFNYDNMLEKVLKKSFKISASVDYVTGTVKGSSDVRTVHVHGYMPDTFLTDPDRHSYEESIVLSSEEYIKEYNSSYGKAYKKLYDQLRKTNIIIGNSMADYEEQKVFRNHHEYYISEYSFAFFKKNPQTWMDRYKMMNCLRMGVIPVFFDKYSDIRDWLEDRISAP